MEERIRALSAEGLSIRQIAAELRINRGKVHRVLAASTDASSGSAVAAVDTVDPILLLLTEADSAHLGFSADDVAAGLSMLERYRVLGLPSGSAAGEAARALFDHGRGEDAFSDWLYTPL